MAVKEYDLWMERFNREIGIKSSVILFGNTSDIMLNTMNSGRYDTVLDTVISNIRQKGFKKIVKWDRVDGIDSKISDQILLDNDNLDEGINLVMIVILSILEIRYHVIRSLMSFFRTFLML